MRISARSIDISLDVFRAQVEMDRVMHSKSKLSHVMPAADAVFKTKTAAVYTHTGATIDG